MAKLHAAFVGFNAETIPSILRYFETRPDPPDDYIHEARSLLLWIATPEKVLHTGGTALKEDSGILRSTYFHSQEHGSLRQVLNPNPESLSQPQPNPDPNPNPNPDPNTSPGGRS